MTRELEAVEEGERRFHSVDPGFTWTDIHTSQLPFLHSWVVWVAGPLLGARFFGFQIVATEFKGIQFLSSHSPCKRKQSAPPWKSNPNHFMTGLQFKRQPPLCGSLRVGVDVVAIGKIAGKHHFFLLSVAPSLFHHFQTVSHRLDRFQYDVELKSNN